MRVRAFRRPFGAAPRRMIAPGFLRLEPEFRCAADAANQAEG